MSLCGRLSVLTRTESTHLKNQRHELRVLRQILKKVSRSFYLSLIILPRTIRPQMSLAYLFCRAADTIADTRLIPHHARLSCLTVFRTQFTLARTRDEDIQSIQLAFTPHQEDEGERQLLLHLPACFRLLACLPDEDQALIQELVLTLTRGMEMDLQCFPAESTPPNHALPDFASLDLYTYYVAGVVGEFWTKLHALHVFQVSPHALQELCTLARRYGKGLQLTNILKDLGKDLSMGRCYIPNILLEECRVNTRSLPSVEGVHETRQLIAPLVWQTLEHLDGAYHYVCQLPRQAVRTRLSCMWPLLFALQTLAVICQSSTLLQPNARVKITRQAVYRTMFSSCYYLISARAFRGHYATLRQRVVHLLPASPA